MSKLEHIGNDPLFFNHTNKTVETIPSKLVGKKICLDHQSRLVLQLARSITKRLRKKRKRSLAQAVPAA